MKKLSILALAAILVVFFTVPASALENEFGGFWRTRFYTQKYFDGLETSDNDDTVDLVDTRTRLYYTAKINDNLKLVNKFEFDATWGGEDTYGQIGADTVSIEVKNSYADFNLGPVNATVGAQPYELLRGFAISDDASGIIARWKAMDNFILAGSWLKNFEGQKDSSPLKDSDGGFQLTDLGENENEDIDTYTVTGAFWFTENISTKVSVSTAYAANLDGERGRGLLGLGAPITALGVKGESDDDHGEAYLVTYGLDFDMTFDKWGLWVTAFGQSGEADDVVLVDNSTEDFDISAFLFAIGGDVSFGEVGFLGNFGLHSEFFYASGDDDVDDDDIEGVVAEAASYYWSEIMGLGVFDFQASQGSPGDKITNIMAFNLGTTMQPMDKLKIALDLWYAERVEDEQTFNEEDELGTELDVRITYELVEGLNLDLIGAYLWADDATLAPNTATDDNDEDPYEFGAQLSLSF